MKQEQKSPRAPFFPDSDHRLQSKNDAVHNWLDIPVHSLAMDTANACLREAENLP